MDHGSIFDFNDKKSVLDFKRPISPSLLRKYLDVFSERYPFINISKIGYSVLGKDIPIITLGEGDRAMLYVGSHHASEWITSIILLRFINEYCELYNNGARIYNFTMQYVFSTRKIYIVPMLNPDGVEYCTDGIAKENILYDRVMRINEGNKSFEHWQANARGVDLNHNYDSGFLEYKKLEQKMGIFGGAPSKYSGTSSESEPEVYALCNFIRAAADIKAVISLHSQGEEIYYSSQGKCPDRALSMANVFSRMSGYRLSIPEGSACYGGLLDWCINKMELPAFTFECGKGENPLPLTDYFRIYSDMRQILFTAPTMI